MKGVDLSADQQGRTTRDQRQQPSQQEPQELGATPKIPLYTDLTRGDTEVPGAAAGVLSRVLPAQAPQHQLCHVALLPRLPAPVGLHLQAPLTPDDGGSRLGKLTPQAGRGTLLSLQALQRLPEHHLWGCGAGIGVKGRGKASPKPEAQSPRQETGTPNPVRPTEGLGQACLTCPQDPLPQAPLEDRSGSGVTGGVYSKGEEGLQWGPQKGPWI